MHALSLTASGLLANLATGVILARGLGPNDRGYVAALIVFATMLGWAAAFGQKSAVTHFVAKGLSLADSLRSAAVVVALPIVLALAIGIVLAPTVVGDSHPLMLSRTFLVVVPLLVGLELLLGGLAGVARFAEMSLARVLPYWGALAGLAWAWVMEGSLTPPVALACSAFGFVVAVLYAGWALSRSEQSPSGPATVTLLGGYGARTLGTQVGTIVNGRLDVVLLSALTTPSTVAFYTLATNLGGVIVGLADGLRGIVLSRVSAGTEVHAAGSASASPVAKAAMLVGAMGLAASCVWMLFAGPLIQFVYGAPFLPASKYVAILAVAATFLAIAGIVGEGLAGLGRPGIPAWIHGIGAVATVLALAVAIPEFGGLGAAWVSFCVYAGIALSSVLAWLSVSRKKNEET